MFNIEINTGHIEVMVKQTIKKQSSKANDW